MTVHGAKGLEAPIVFLPDTCSTRSGRRPGSLLRLEGAERPSSLPPPFLWPVKGTSGLAVVQQAKAAVALAEARGAQPPALRRADPRARPALRRGLRGAQAAASRLLVQPDPAGLGRPPRRDDDGGWTQDLADRSAQAAPPERSTAKGGTSADAPTLPAWASRLAPPEPLVRIPLAPSRLAPLDTDAAGEPVGAQAEPPRGARHPAAGSPPRRRPLPARHPHARPARAPAAAAARDLAGEGQGVRGAAGAATCSCRAQEHRRGGAGRSAATRRSRRCSGPRAAPRCPSPPRCRIRRGAGRRCSIAGQIDRLAIEGDSVWIVDYKTNRPPPDRPGPGCGGLPAATRRLSSCSAAHLSGHAGQGCDPVDRRPENHGDSRRSAGRAPAPTLAAGGGCALTLGAALPTFRPDDFPPQTQSQQGV